MADIRTGLRIVDVAVPSQPVEVAVVETAEGVEVVLDCDAAVRDDEPGSPDETTG